MPDFDLGRVLGEDAPKIESIEKTSTSGLVDTYTITLEDGSEYTFDVTNGEDGSIVEVTQVLSSGTKLATLTIDGVDTDLYCSSGGSADIVTSWESTLSDSKVPSEKLTKETIDTKISKSQTSGLVKNDGTVSTDLNTIISIINYLANLNATLFTLDSQNALVYLFNDKLTYDTDREEVYYNGEELATMNDIPSISGKADKTGWTASKNIVTDSNGALTTENKNEHSHGNLNSDGSLGSGSGLSGYIVVLDSNNKLIPTGSINASKIKDSNAYSNLGTSANATQSQINSAIDTLIGDAITYINGSGS